MKFLPLFGLLLVLQTSFYPAQAQERNPLINSGELIKNGSDLYDSGEYKRSIDLYRKIDRNDTNYVRALYETALSYYADSQFAKSAQFCQTALATRDVGNSPLHPQILDEYANAVDAGGDPQGALKIFDSAIGKYPAFAYLYMNKGTVLLKLDRNKEAEQILQQAILLDPYSYTSHFKLGIVTLRQGKLIPAMLSLIGYLLMNPEGRYHGSCINVLSSISKNEDEIQKYVNNRKEDPSENYQLPEQIIQSKIALDKNYKPLIHLDDAISRQIQVLFEKLKYEEGDKDFYMQYYMPYFSRIFAAGQFELFINHIFSGVNIPLIQNYIKKNKKEISAFTHDAGNYFNLIRSTHEIMPSRRDMTGPVWYFSDGKLVGKGRATADGGKLMGPWTFYYEFGNIKAKGDYNETGQKDGPWLYYFFDGRLKGKEIYQNDRQEGEETYYTHDGGIAHHSWYKNNLPEGEYISYFTNGNINIIDHYEAGKEEGVKKTYYSNGTISMEDNMKAGLRNGESRSWNENGTLDYIANYKNDKLDGPYKKYFANGQIATSGDYSTDQQNGPWKYFYENGKVKEEATFVAGKAEGQLSHYYQNGQLEYSYMSKKGRAQGEEAFYDEDGKLYCRYILDDNKLMSANYFDKTGKLISESAYRQKQTALTSFDAAGIKKMECVYNDRGNTIGTKTYYYPSGGISQTETYKDGELNGPLQSFYPDAAKKDSFGYTDGAKDGYMISRYTHGQVKEEGWYKKNQAQGYWLYYNELGNLTDSIYYIDDKINGFRTEFFPNGKKEFESEYRYGYVLGTTQFDTSGKPIWHTDLPNGSGHYTLIHPNGKPFLDANYVHGHLEGPRKTYYFNGSVRMEEYFHQGLQDSIQKNYNDLGILSWEHGYHAGDRAGTWKWYDDHGKLSHTEEYKEGQLNGKRIYYYPNGNKEEECTMKDGDLDGAVMRYDPSGALLYQLTFKEGRLISYTYQGSTGQLLKDIPVAQETGRIKTYFSNGTVSADIGYKDGYLDGTITQYYLNGKIREQSYLHYGNNEGPRKTYYDNGQIEHDYIYLHDNLQGHYKEFNERGILTEEGEFYNGFENGIIKHYDDSGKLIATANYYYGRLLSLKK